MQSLIMWKDSTVVRIIWISSAFVFLLGLAGVIGGAYLTAQVKPFNAKFVSWDCEIIRRDSSMGWRSASASCTWKCTWNNGTMPGDHCGCDSKCGVWIGSNGKPIIQPEVGYSGTILLMMVGLSVVFASISCLAGGLKHVAKGVMKGEYESLA